MNMNVSSLGKLLSNLEKRCFPWRKARLVSGQPAFFPGCNLVNFLPVTARETIGLFQEMGCGWLYDCCSKPLKLSGDAAGSARMLRRINRQLQQAGVTELIVACPNCYSVFKEELGIPVKDIYTFLRERAHPCALSARVIHTFPPCPDRKEGVIGRAIAQWTGSEVSAAKQLPCCGLAVPDPVRARQGLAVIRRSATQLTPYCASCYGHLNRNGITTAPHLLTAGLGLSEKPATGIRQGVNRMKPWLWK